MCFPPVRFKTNHPPPKGFTGIADQVKNFAVLYVCDLDQVPDFKQMYELYDPVTLMFFFRNKHMMCDFGTGNNNKLHWVLEDKQELLCLVRRREATKGGLGRRLAEKTANGVSYCRLLDPIQILDIGRRI